jgi:hypothetical protein
MTVEQVRELCPDSSPEFILDVIQSKQTNPEIIKLKWEVANAKLHCGPTVVPARPETIQPEPESEDSRTSAPFFHSPEISEQTKIAGVVVLAILAYWLATKAYVWVVAKTAGIAVTIAKLRSILENETSGTKIDAKLPINVEPTAPIAPIP